jgi:hypothetical protein
MLPILLSANEQQTKGLQLRALFWSNQNGNKLKAIDSVKETRIRTKLWHQKAEFGNVTGY